jgi:hypothetical protein
MLTKTVNILLYSWGWNEHSHSPNVSAMHTCRPAPIRGDPVLGPVQGFAPVGGSPSRSCSRGRRSRSRSCSHGSRSGPGLASMGVGQVQVLLPKEEVPFPGPIICAERPQVLLSTFFSFFRLRMAVIYERNDAQTNFSWFDCYFMHIHIQYN